MKSLETALYALGITIGYENFEQLQQLEAAFTAEYNPATPTERALVDSLAHTEWMLRRYRWLETEVWNAARLALPPEQRTRAWPAHVFVAEKAIAQIHRLRNSAQRTFRETVAVLHKLQSGRPVSAPAAEDRAPAPQPVAIPVVAPAPQGSSTDPLPPPDQSAAGPSLPTPALSLRGGSSRLRPRAPESPPLADAANRQVRPAGSMNILTSIPGPRGIISLL